MKHLIAALVWSTIALPALAGMEESIVGLYVRGNQVDLGTGFFTSDSGQIMTAYHVVRGAQGIKAVDATGTIYSDLIVDFIAPDRDLAILQIADLPTPKTRPLALTSTIPSPSEELTIIGYPRGLPSQFVHARTTSSTPLSSLVLRDSNDRRLFEQEMDLVMLSGPVAYSGLSGAPVVSKEGVIGVFSGSYDEPGGIFWAIPNKYMKDLRSVRKRPAEITSWPSTMMAGGFRSLKRQFKVNPQGEKLLDAYLEAVTQFSRSSEQLGSTAMRVDGLSMLWRPVLESVVSDPSLTEDQASVMMEPLQELFFPYLDAYGKAHDAFGQASALVVIRLEGLSRWTSDEANLSLTAKQALHARITEIEKTAPTNDYYGALGEDFEQVKRKAAEFAVELAKLTERSPPSEVAEVFLMALDIAPPSKHASLEAIRERSRWLSTFRQFASAFEPIVYQ